VCGEDGSVVVNNRGQAHGGLFKGVEHCATHRSGQGMRFQHPTFFHTMACWIGFFCCVSGLILENQWILCSTAGSRSFGRI
jgi:hypothetical protein